MEGKDGENEIGEWVGSYSAMVVVEEKKLVYIHNCYMGAARPFNVTQGKPCVKAGGSSTFFYG